MLSILFLTLAVLGGARSALIGFKAQLESAYNQGADDALAVVEAHLEARR